MWNKSIVNGLGWKFLERIGTQGIVFIVSLILARLLSPKEYGTIALITIFIDLATVFVYGGLNIALIQKKDIADEDYSSVFSLSMIMAVITYAILFVTSPHIAEFYNNEELTIIIRVLAIILFPCALNSVQIAYVSRELDFKKIFFSSLISVVISGIVGIIVARKGLGVWALVIQQILNHTFNALILSFFIDWKPQKVFSYERLKILFDFGYKILLSNLLGTFYNNVYGLLIGKIYSDVELGYYSKGKQIPALLMNNLDSSIQSVMLPVLARKQSDKEQLKIMARRILKASTLLVFPAMLGLYVLSEPIIKLLLGERWLGCISFFRAACVIYIIYPFHTTNLQTINAIGRSDIFFEMEIKKKIVGIVILCCTIWGGINTLIFGEILTNYISLFINTRMSNKLFGYSLYEQIYDVIIVAIAAVFMGFFVYSLTKFLINDLLIVLCGTCMGALFYFGEIVLLIRMRLLKF